MINNEDKDLENNVNEKVNTDTNTDTNIDIKEKFNNVNNIILKIIIGLSILIIIGGFFSGSSIFKELKDSVDNQIEQEVYIDGTDMTEITKASGTIVSGIMSVVMVIYSIMIVCAIWIIYGFIYFISKIVINNIVKNNK